MVHRKKRNNQLEERPVTFAPGAYALQKIGLPSLGEWGVFSYQLEREVMAGVPGNFT